MCLYGIRVMNIIIAKPIAPEGGWVAYKVQLLCDMSGHCVIDASYFKTVFFGGDHMASVVPIIINIKI